MSQETIIAGVVLLNLVLLILLLGALRLLKLKPPKLDTSLQESAVIDLDAELRALFSHDSWNGIETPNGHSDPAGG